MKKNVITTLLVILLAAGYVAAQPPSPPPPPSAEDRLRHLSEQLDKELQLTTDQKQKVLTTFKDFFVKMDELVGKNTPPPPPPPANKEEMDKAVNERDKNLKTIMSSEQFNKFKEMEMHMREHVPMKPGKGVPPPTSK